MTFAEWAELNRLRAGQLMNIFAVTRVTVFNWARRNKVASELDRQMIWAVQRVFPGMTEADVMSLAPDKTQRKWARLGIKTLDEARQLMPEWERAAFANSIQRALQMAELARDAIEHEEVRRRPGRPSQHIKRTMCYNHVDRRDEPTEETTP